MGERERTIAVLEAVASSEWTGDDMSTWCFFCSADGEYPSTEEQYEDRWHTADCPIVVARALLAEQGIPLYLYRVDFEIRAAQRKQWEAAHWYVPAFSEAEVRSKWPEDTDLNDKRNAKRRNVQVSICKVLDGRHTRSEEKYDRT